MERGEPVCCVESLFDPISVMDINVNIQDSERKECMRSTGKVRSEEGDGPRMVFQELEDSQDNVIDITEPRGFHLLRMMKTSRPIDGNVGQTMIEFDSAVQ
jgi:hypothetical protein